MTRNGDRRRPHTDANRGAESRTRVWAWGGFARVHPFVDDPTSTRKARQSPKEVNSVRDDKRIPELRFRLRLAWIAKSTTRAMTFERVRVPTLSRFLQFAVHPDESWHS